MFNNGNGKTRRNMGMGIEGTCYCPDCGYEASHKRGAPCYEIKCPSCGVALIRKELNSVTGRDNMKPSVNQASCIGCRRCVSICPVNAISMENGKAKINKSLCISCKRCINVCPVHAIV